jgi:hypothetical protein
MARIQPFGPATKQYEVIIAHVMSPFNHSTGRETARRLVNTFTTLRDISCLDISRISAYHHTIGKVELWAAARRRSLSWKG